MSEWWTYSLADFLLFSPKTYYRLFELYNQAVWPAQGLNLGLGLLVLWLVACGGARAGRVASAILAACWLWVAWAYLYERYATINWAAEYFAAGFVLQALLLAWTGAIHDRLVLERPSDAQFPPMSPSAKADGPVNTDVDSLHAGLAVTGSPPPRGRRRWILRRMTGIALVVLGLLYPLIALLAGRPWTQAEMFGLAPDPTVVGTLGVLLATQRPHAHLVIIPLFWCAISGATLWTMQAPEALLLPIAGAAALGFTVRKAMAPAPKAGLGRHNRDRLTCP